MLIIQFNINHLFAHNVNGFKYSKLLDSSIWLIDGTLRGTTTPSQSGPGSDGSEGVFHIPQDFKAGTSPSDVL